MTFTKLVPRPHICVNPAYFYDEPRYAIGSLWECNECGREWMKVKDKNQDTKSWKPTVEVITK